MKGGAVGASSFCSPSPFIPPFHCLTVPSPSLSLLPSLPIADSAAPTGTDSVLSVVAVQNIPFYAPLPTAMFGDATDVTITSATPSSAVGLTVVPGVNGLAYITGTATAAPVTAPTGCSNAGIFFTVNAVDAAGNTASAKLCVRILGSSSEWEGEGENRGCR